MKISKDDVQYVASLAKLSFEESELEKMTKDLDKIIDMVENLNTVDTTGVPFTSNVTEEINVFRKDVSVVSETRDELLSNVPQTKDGYIKVPAIMDNGEVGA